MTKFINYNIPVRDSPGPWLNEKGLNRNFPEPLYPRVNAALAIGSQTGLNNDWEFDAHTLYQLWCGVTAAAVEGVVHGAVLLPRLPFTRRCANYGYRSPNDDTISYHPKSRTNLMPIDAQGKVMMLGEFADFIKRKVLYQIDIFNQIGTRGVPKEHLILFADMGFGTSATTEILTTGTHAPFCGAWSTLLSSGAQNIFLQRQDLYQAQLAYFNYVLINSMAFGYVRGEPSVDGVWLETSNGELVMRYNRTNARLVRPYCLNDDELLDRFGISRRSAMEKYKGFWFMINTRVFANTQLGELLIKTAAMQMRTREAPTFKQYQSMIQYKRPPATRGQMYYVEAERLLRVESYTEARKLDIDDDMAWKWRKENLRGGEENYQDETPLFGVTPEDGTLTQKSRDGMKFKMELYQKNIGSKFLVGESIFLPYDADSAYSTRKDYPSGGSSLTAEEELEAERQAEYINDPGPNRPTPDNRQGTRFTQVAEPTGYAPRPQTQQPQTQPQPVPEVQDLIDFGVVTTAEVQQQQREAQVEYDAALAVLPSGTATKDMEGAIAIAEELEQRELRGDRLAAENVDPLRLSREEADAINEDLLEEGERQSAIQYVTEMVKGSIPTIPEISVLREVDERLETVDEEIVTASTSLLTAVWAETEDQADAAVLQNAGQIPINITSTDAVLLEPGPSTQAVVMSVPTGLSQPSPITPAVYASLMTIIDAVYSPYENLAVQVDKIETPGVDKNAMIKFIEAARIFGIQIETLQNLVDQLSEEDETADSNSDEGSIDGDQGIDSGAPVTFGTADIASCAMHLWRDLTKQVDESLTTDTSSDLEERPEIATDEDDQDYWISPTAHMLAEGFGRTAELALTTGVTEITSQFFASEKDTTTEYYYKPTLQGMFVSALAAPEVSTDMTKESTPLPPDTDFDDLVQWGLADSAVASNMEEWMNLPYGYSMRSTGAFILEQTNNIREVAQATNLKPKTTEELTKDMDDITGQIDTIEAQQEEDALEEGLTAPLDEPQEILTEAPAGTAEINVLQDKLEDLEDTAQVEMPEQDDTPGGLVSTEDHTIAGEQDTIKVEVQVPGRIDTGTGLELQMVSVTATVPSMEIDNDGVTVLKAPSSDFSSSVSGWKHLDPVAMKRAEAEKNDLIETNEELIRRGDQLATYASSSSTGDSSSIMLIDDDNLIVPAAVIEDLNNDVLEESGGLRTLGTSEGELLGQFSGMSIENSNALATQLRQIKPAGARIAIRSTTGKSTRGRGRSKR